MAVQEHSKSEPEMASSTSARAFLKPLVISGYRLLRHCINPWPRSRSTCLIYKAKIIISVNTRTSFVCSF
jgi:hypothetical protein